MPSWSGNGSANYGSVAYARDLGYYKSSATTEYPYQRYAFGDIIGKITDPACYGLYYWDCPGCSSGWKNYVFFGGPGSEAPGCN